MKQLRTAVVAFALMAVLLASMGSVAEAGGNANPCKGKNATRPECQVPEVPWTLILPVAGVGVAGAYYLVQRRLHRDDAPVEG